MYKEAFEANNRFENKEMKIYLSIKKLCLKKLSENVSISYGERKQYLSQLHNADGVAEIDMFDVIDEL